MTIEKHDEAAQHDEFASGAGKNLLSSLKYCADDSDEEKEREEAAIGTCFPTIGGGKESGFAVRLISIVLIARSYCF